MPVILLLPGNLHPLPFAAWSYLQKQLLVAVTYSLHRQLLQQLATCSSYLQHLRTYSGYSSFMMAITFTMLLNAAVAMLTALLILTALCSSNIRNVTQCSGSSYTYSITNT